MDLPDAVQAVFAPGGPLAQSVPGFTARAGQLQMAAQIAGTLQHGGLLVAEAGTGIGKTFAYLIPALLSGERVLVSTATKALQDQLFTRDIPQLRSLLGVPARVALLKGRSSYVCLHHLDAALDRETSISLATHAMLSDIRLWAQGTRTGDLAEFPALEEQSPLRTSVTSTRENCLGSRCPQVQACHVNQARREAMSADVVVVNHHLFFADMQVRESGVAELLPSVRCVIFDEAHQLNEIGVQFLGDQLTGRQLLNFCSAVEALGPQLVCGAIDWRGQLAAIRGNVESLQQLAGQAGEPSRSAWSGAVPSGVEVLRWRSAFAALQSALQGLLSVLQRLSESSIDLAALHARAQLMVDLVACFGAAAPPAQVRWMEVTPSWRLVQSPLDVADAMRTRVFPPPEQGSRKSWVFTSATLGNDDALSWFVQSCGLQGAQVMRVPSPFDHEGQAGLYVPDEMPEPQDGAHSASVAALVADAATVLGGRTLVLTTSLRAMHAIGQALQTHFDAHGPIDVLVQGQQGKRDLLARFAGNISPGSRGRILVGAASFWEGIDIPGEALQLVVIDKLPFPPPGDPLVEARVQDLNQKGGNGFRNYFLPQMVVALKQGVGRLIRSETDRGILVICDVRLRRKSYGRGILAALPPMRHLASEAQFHEALVALTIPLTRPSTRDRPSL